MHMYLLPYKCTCTCTFFLKIVHVFIALQIHMYMYVLCYNCTLYCPTNAHVLLYVLPYS